MVASAAEAVELAGSFGPPALGRAPPSTPCTPMPLLLELAVSKPPNPELSSMRFPRSLSAISCPMSLPSSMNAWLAVKPSAMVILTEAHAVVQSDIHARLGRGSRLASRWPS